MSAPINNPEPWSLAGKTAVVTGASRGIGKAIAIHLARKGLANIAITYASNKAAAGDTIAKCRALGVKNAIVLQADALDPDVWPRVIKDSLAGLNTPMVDILVNNAIFGTFHDFKPAAETTAQDFSKLMIANAYTPAVTTLAFMEHAAPKHGGRVINISSVAGRDANNDPIIAYGASKAALESYTRSFAGSFASTRGMTFNSVIVGPTATEAMVAAFGELPADFKETQFKMTSAAPRLGEPDDIAYIVGFLASEEGRWVNGAAISANGGYRTVLASLG